MLFRSTLNDDMREYTDSKLHEQDVVLKRHDRTLRKLHLQSGSVRSSSLRRTSTRKQPVRRKQIKNPSKKNINSAANRRHKSRLKRLKDELTKITSKLKN